MTSIINTLKTGSIAFAVVLFVVLAIPSAVRAADCDSCGGYTEDYFVPSDSGYTDDYFVPNDSGYTEDYFVPDTSYDTGYDTGYSPSYYTGSGYLGGSFLGGSSYLPTSGGNYQTQAQSQAQAQTQSSNNTNVNNNIITINTPTQTNPTPNPVCPSGSTGTYPNCYTQPTYNYPVCTLTVNNYQNGYNYNQYQPVTLSWTSQYATSGFISNGVGSVALSGSVTVNPQYTTTYTGTFYGQNGQQVTCSATVTRNSAPIVYNNQTPYVALSAVPYTGLDLGFWGTIAYWGFLVLWCLVAAYLVVVKKVQNRILSALNGFLFGDSATTHQVVAVATPAGQTFVQPVAASKVDAIDDFILSQINRTR